MPLTLDSLKGRPIVEIFQRKGADGQPLDAWDWHMKGTNGEIMCGTNQGYTHKDDAVAAYLRVKDALEYELEVRYAP